MGHYAKGSTVTPERTKAEIERTLTRFGVSHYVCGYQENQGFVGFVYEQMPVRVTINLPEKSKYRFTSQGRIRHNDSLVIKAWEQACREHWRGLLLLVKAKLVAIENKHSTFRREFMADMVLPNGGTIEQWLTPKIDILLETGKMPQALLPGLTGDKEIASPGPETRVKGESSCTERHDI